MAAPGIRMVRGRCGRALSTEPSRLNAPDQPSGPAAWGTITTGARCIPIRLQGYGLERYGVAKRRLRGSVFVARIARSRRR